MIDDNERRAHAAEEDLRRVRPMFDDFAGG